MSRTKYIVLSVAAAIVAFVAWMFFQPDEAPMWRDAVAFNDTRQASEATIGLLGLEAPAGTDFMEHGRLVFAEAVRTGGYPMDATGLLLEGKPRLEARYRESLECWLYLPGEEMPEEVSRNCASPVQLQAILDENAELLNRYRAIQKMQVAADGEAFRAQTVITLGKLMIADIANDLRLGETERAYRKWADNHRHQSQMAGYAGNWVMVAVNQVNEGLSFTSLDLLFAKAPRLIQSHREELLELVKPRDRIIEDIAATLRGEIRVFEQIRADVPEQHRVRINRLRNRFAAYSNDFVAAVATSPSNPAAPVAAVKARHIAPRMSDIFDPSTASAWELLMSGQLKQGELINMMYRKEAQRRLYTIKIMRATANASDGNFEADMEAAPRELRSPFDGSPAQWDADQRVLYFAVAGGGRVQITIAQPKPRMTKAAVAKIAAEVAKQNGVSPAEYVQGDVSIDRDLLPRLRWWVFFTRKNGPDMDCYIVWVEDTTGKAEFLSCEPRR